MDVPPRLSLGTLRGGYLYRDGLEELLVALALIHLDIMEPP
jgi:hypothetical protein